MFHSFFIICIQREWSQATRGIVITARVHLRFYDILPSFEWKKNFSFWQLYKNSFSTLGFLALFSFSSFSSSIPFSPTIIDMHHYPAIFWMQVHVMMSLLLHLWCSMMEVRSVEVHREQTARSQWLGWKCNRQRSVCVCPVIWEWNQSGKETKRESY